MARDLFINGPALVQVKSRSDSNIGSLTQLGLSEGDVVITPTFNHDDVNVDAWGQGVVDIQWMLAEMAIRFTLVHFDRDVLDTCLRLSMGFPNAIGQMAKAGARLGNNLARFAVGNNLIGLNISSPDANKPWRFYYAFMTGPPVTMPLGTKRSLVTVNFRAIPYVSDPWQGGVGAANYVLYDHVLDT